MFSTERAVICSPRERWLRMVSEVRDSVHSVWIESENLMWIKMQIFEHEGDCFPYKTSRQVEVMQGRNRS